jgi:hypothetical protein
VFGRDAAELHVGPDRWLAFARRRGGSTYALADSAEHTMSKVRCSKCGKEHVLDHIEPSFKRPAAYLTVPTAERERRITESDDACMITSQDGQHLACFIRAVLYVPISARDRLSDGVYGSR